MPSWPIQSIILCTLLSTRHIFQIQRIGIKEVPDFRYDNLTEVTSALAYSVMSSRESITVETPWQLSSLHITTSGTCSTSNNTNEASLLAGNDRWKCQLVETTPQGHATRWRWQERKIITSSNGFRLYTGITGYRPSLFSSDKLISIRAMLLIFMQTIWHTRD